MEPTLFVYYRGLNGSNIVQGDGEDRQPPNHGSMARKTTAKFDPNVFLATLDGGRNISSFKKDGVVFEQGAPANAVLYIQKGKNKILVTSDQGKEAVVAIHGTGDFIG